MRRDVVIGIVGEPASALSDDAGGRLLAYAVTEQLVRRDARDELVPRLAEEVPTLENGGVRLVFDDTALTGRMVALFRLRPALRWQDGTPLTTDDVAFAWQEDRTAPAGSDARYYADRVERIEIIDALRVRFVYRPGDRADDLVLAARVSPRHLLGDATPATRAAYARKPVHAGPFSVAAWVPGFGVTLARYRDYALGEPPIGRLEIRFFATRSALLDALRRGEVDIAPSPSLEADLARTLDRTAEAARLQAYYTPSESLDVLRFPPADTRFGSLALRRAISLAVDRHNIVDELFAGRARVPPTYLVPPLAVADDAGAVARADRDAARAVLAAAGFNRGTLGVRERAGDRLVVTLLVASGSASRIEAAHMVAGDLAAVGIAATVRERPIDEVFAAVARGEFDLALVPQRADDAARATAEYAGHDPWFDVLAEAARRAAPPDKRAIYGELQRLWSDVPMALPLYQRLQVDVAPARLEGIRPVAHGAPLTWNVAEWRFAP